MKICSYIIKSDKGFNPNPFSGYCTLSSCTPNHMGVKLDVGDWILGFTTKSLKSKLIYAMEITEILNFNDYFHDPRFQNKKPNLNGKARERCGDNIYYLDDKDQWCQIETIHHCEESYLKKDTKYPKVFISNYFFYFGHNAINLPTNLKQLIWDRQGCKMDYPTPLILNFIDWIKNNYTPGESGIPQDLIV